MAAEKAMGLDTPSIDWKQVDRYQKKAVNLLKRKVPVGGVRPVSIKNMIRDLMWEHVHMLRDEKGLMVALEGIRKIRETYLPKMEMASDTLTWNYDWVEGLEVLNMIDVAEMVTNSALNRTETRGAHEREDYPKKDDENWIKNIVIKREEEKMNITTRPAVITKLKPGE